MPALCYISTDYSYCMCVSPRTFAHSTSDACDARLHLDRCDVALDIMHFSRILVCDHHILV